MNAAVPLMQAVPCGARQSCLQPPFQAAVPHRARQAASANARQTQRRETSSDRAAIVAFLGSHSGPFHCFGSRGGSPQLGSANARETQNAFNPMMQAVQGGSGQSCLPALFEPALPHLASQSRNPSAGGKQRRSYITHRRKPSSDGAALPRFAASQPGSSDCAGPREALTQYAVQPRPARWHGPRGARQSCLRPLFESMLPQSASQPSPRIPAKGRNAVTPTMEPRPAHWHKSPLFESTLQSRNPNVCEKQRRSSVTLLRNPSPGGAALPQSALQTVAANSSERQNSVTPTMQSRPAHWHVPCVAPLFEAASAGVLATRKGGRA